MATEAEAGGQPEDLHDQIARLRAQLETLVKEKVTPAVAAAAGVPKTLPTRRGSRRTWWWVRSRSGR